MTELFFHKATSLLEALIQVQSFSKEEDESASLIHDFLKQEGVEVYRKANNIWAYNENYDKKRPTILLNSHHDTVKPNVGYTMDPFLATIMDDKLYGLGSNDAGASLVSLFVTFLYFHSKSDLRYNLVFAATAEEEISGLNGVASILKEIGQVDFAIVGEPTSMQMATAEKGLLVVDCISFGEAGHAARSEGKNAIYESIEDLIWFQNYEFPKVSDLLGKVHMNVTQIEAGTQHNVVPDRCKFTVDIRVTDVYSHEEILSIIEENTTCEITARSTRLKSSSIPVGHPIVRAGLSHGLSTFGSPTLSDQALMPFLSLKLGPGDSIRSHTADEFVYLEQIKEGIEVYIKLLKELME